MIHSLENTNRTESLQDKLDRLVFGDSDITLGHATAPGWLRSSTPMTVLLSSM